MSSSEWTLDAALELIRSIQPRLHERKWHAALAGGVLNYGWSSKDLDLVMLPFNNAETKADIMPFLCELWGAAMTLGEITYDEAGIFSAMVKFHIGPRRVDVFVARIGPLTAAAVDPSEDSNTGKLSTRV